MTTASITSIASLASVDALEAALRAHNYIAERGLATAIYLALKPRRPLFLEGEAGVGKTEIPQVLAQAMHTELIRLQCYEGLDINHAVYDWNYTRQLMHIRLMEAKSERIEDEEAELYKLPGVAETLDRITALVALDQTALDEQVVDETLGVILKYQDDVVKARTELNKSILAIVSTGYA